MQDWMEKNPSSISVLIIILLVNFRRFVTLVRTCLQNEYSFEGYKESGLRQTCILS